MPRQVFKDFFYKQRANKMSMQQTLLKVDAADNIQFTSPPCFKHEETPWKKYFTPFFANEPEANYITGVTLNDLMGGGVGGGAVKLSTPVSMGIAVGWNWFDGLDSIITGLDQIYYADDHHHSFKKKMQRVANILSGAQLLLFSWIPEPLRHAAGLASATSLAGSAFALSMVFDLINAGLDYHYRLKKSIFKGWLEEKLLKLNFLDEKIAKLTNKQTDQLKFIAKRDRLLKSISIRCQYYCNTAKSDDEYQYRKQFIITKCESHLTHSYSKIYSDTLDTSNYYSRLKFFTKKLDSAELNEVKKQEREIQTHLDKREAESRHQLLIKGFSFVGMACLAIAPFVACPPLAVIGMAITTGVAIYYLYHHSDKIIKNCKQLFFHESKTPPPIDKIEHSHLDEPLELKASPAA